MHFTKEQNALLRAVRQQQLHQLRYLLNKRRIDPNFPLIADTTPLHEAVKKDNLAIIKILVAAGADVSCTTCDGATPQGLAEDLRASQNIIDYLKNEGNKLLLKASASSAPRKKSPAAKKIPAPQSVKPVFNAKTLPEIFASDKWVGKVEKMRQLWETVPKRLKNKFDFAAALTAARQKTLKNQAPKKALLKKDPPPRPPSAD